MRFPATVEPAGNATGIEIPAEIVTALGAGKCPKVAITINGHTWRSRVASVGGRFIVGISAANRAVPAPEAIALSPDGKNAYVTSEHEGALSQFAISPGTGKITPLSPATVTAPSHGSLGVAVTP